jgi:hypothetical protein
MSTRSKLVKRALIAFGIATLLVGFRYYGWGPCGKSKVRDAAAKYSKVLKQWQSAVDELPEIPRQAMEPQLAALQSLRDDLGAIEPPECMTLWHNQLDKHMQKRLDELQAFVDGGNGISLDAQQMKSLRVRLTSFVACAPKCPTKVVGGDPNAQNRIVQLKTRGGFR